MVTILRPYSFVLCAFFSLSTILACGSQQDSSSSPARNSSDATAGETQIKFLDASGAPQTTFPAIEGQGVAVTIQVKSAQTKTFAVGVVAGPAGGQITNISADKWSFECPAPAESTTVTVLVRDVAACMKVENDQQFCSSVSSSSSGSSKSYDQEANFSVSVPTGTYSADTSTTVASASSNTTSTIPSSTTTTTTTSPSSGSGILGQLGSLAPVLSQFGVSVNGSTSPTSLITQLIGGGCPFSIISTIMKLLGM